MGTIWYIDNKIAALKVKKYQILHPNENIIFSAAARAVSRAFETDVDMNSDFIDAKRTVFILTDKIIAVREWRINLQDITKAELNSYDSIYGRAMVLKLKTKSGANYQVGMPFNQDILNQNLFPIEHKEIEVPYIRIYRIVRPILIIIMFVCLILWIIRKFFI